MKVTYIGQAGLIFDFDGIKIIIDPYLSDNVKNHNPQNYRRQPINSKVFEIKPYFIILTHNHLDHTDPETLKIFFQKYDQICVLASFNAWNEIKKFGGNNNYVLFNEGTVWTEKGITLEAVYAEHSDSCSIGVVIKYQKKIYYITGDTLYNKKVLHNAPKSPDILFVPINGTGNNMNCVDALRFSKEIKAKKTIPIHFGMFDNLSNDANEFACKINGGFVMKVYEQYFF